LKNLTELTAYIIWISTTSAKTARLVVVVETQYHIFTHKA